MPQVRHVSRGRHGCPYSAGARRARARQLKKDTHVARKAAHFRAKAVHLRAKAVHLRAKAVHLRAKAVHLRAYVLVVCIHFALNPLSGGEQGGVARGGGQGGAGGGRGGRGESKTGLLRTPRGLL
jgi:hypothetical protein